MNFEQKYTKEQYEELYQYIPDAKPLFIELLRLEGQVKILREALQWYIDEQNLFEYHDGYEFDFNVEGYLERARKALVDADKFWETLVNGNE